MFTRVSPAFATSFHILGTLPGMDRAGCLARLSQPFAYTSPGVRQSRRRPQCRWLGLGQRLRDDAPATAGSLQRTYTVLTGYLYPTMLKLQYGLSSALAAAYNDYVAEHWLAKDKRFIGSIQINARDPEEVAREIDRMAGHPQIKQVMLPVVEDIAYGHPMYRPIFEAAERHGLVIALHIPFWPKDRSAWGCITSRGTPCCRHR